MFELALIEVFRRAWLPLVIVVVLCVAGFTVHRLRSVFGSEPLMVVPNTFVDEPESFDPKVVKYEVFGPPHALASINYLDLDIAPQRVNGVVLPWELTLSTTEPSVFPNLVAQGDGNTIGCRITVDGVVEDENISVGVDAQTFCLVKSA